MPKWPVLYISRNILGSYKLSSKSSAGSLTDSLGEVWFISEITCSKRFLGPIGSFKSEMSSLERRGTSSTVIWFWMKTL